MAEAFEDCAICKKEDTLAKMHEEIIESYVNYYIIS